MQVKTDETDGYTSLQLGVGEKKRKNVTKPLTRHFAKAGVKPKRKVLTLAATRVVQDALQKKRGDLGVKGGTTMLASHV